MHLGDPLKLIDVIFEQYEKPEHRDKSGSMSNYVHDFMIFTEKLKAINNELDLAIAARFAKVLIE